MDHSYFINWNIQVLAENWNNMQTHQRKNCLNSEVTEKTILIIVLFHLILVQVFHPIVFVQYSGCKATLSVTEQIQSIEIMWQTQKS